MKKCNECGMYVENEVKFCPACGTAFESSEEWAEAESAFDSADIRDNKVMAVLAYMGLLVLIPLFAAKESRFVRYHAKQGLILLIAEMIFAVSYCILSFIVLSISWRLYFIVKIAGMASYLFPVLAVIGIGNVVGGRTKELPVIGNIL